MGFYFGTGGLVRAYSEATLKSIEMAERIEIELGTEYEVKIQYENFQSIQYYFQKNNIKMCDTKYEEFIICNIQISNSIKERFLEDIKNKEIKIDYIKEISQKYIKK